MAAAVVEVPVAVPRKPLMASQLRLELSRKSRMGE